MQFQLQNKDATDNFFESSQNYIPKCESVREFNDVIRMAKKEIAYIRTFIMTVIFKNAAIFLRIRVIFNFIRSHDIAYVH